MAYKPFPLTDIKQPRKKIVKHSETPPSKLTEEHPGRSMLPTTHSASTHLGISAALTRKLESFEPYIHKLDLLPKGEKDEQGRTNTQRRTGFILFLHMQGWSNVRIAKHLQLTDSAVYSAIKRAKRKEIKPFEPPNWKKS